MSRNAAYAQTVTFLPDVAPTLEARREAWELFTNQASPVSEELTDYLYTNEELGVWGFISDTAALLFRIPKE